METNLNEENFCQEYAEVFFNFLTFRILTQDPGIIWEVNLILVLK